MRKILLWTVVTLAATVFSVTVWAGIAMSPMVTELSLPPGSSYEDVIHITNTGDEAVFVKVDVCGFIAPEGVPLLLEHELGHKYTEEEPVHYPYCGHELFTLEPSGQTIEPGETFNFHYRVFMPEELDPYGGRYAAVVFQVVPPASESQVKVTTRVASLFLLNPGGDVAPDFSFKLLGIRQSETDHRQIVIEGRMQNLGNLHMSADQVFGIVHVVDQDGYIIDQFEAFAHTMLPGKENTHTHEVTWTAPDTLLSGTYLFHIIIINFRPFGYEHGHVDIEEVVELKFLE